jgi:hypothetical protein
MTEKHNKYALLGTSNFSDWYKRFLNQCHIDGWLISNSDSGTKLVFSSDSTIVKAIKSWLNNNIADSAIGEFDASKSITESIQQLKNSFGHGYLNISDYRSMIEKAICFPPTKNPRRCFLWLQKQLQVLQGAGDIAMSDKELVALMVKALDPDRYPKPFFWENCLTELKTDLYLGSLGPAENFEATKIHIMLHWQLKASQEVKMKEALADYSSDTIGSVNMADGSRSCTFCSRPELKRLNLKNGHNTERCFYGDNIGFVKLNKNGQQYPPSPKIATNCFSQSNQSNTPKYYYDTGATPTSFVKTKPNNFLKVLGNVNTAGENTFETKGTGTVTLGKMKLGATWCPKFTHNLISGIDVMKAGYSSIIQNNRLIITTENVDFDFSQVVATGSLDKTTGLLQIDNASPNSANFATAKTITTYDQMHARLGHPGHAMMDKTIKAVNGVQIQGKCAKDLCVPCQLGKKRRLNISKKGSAPKDILEVVSADTTGPFRVNAIDGTRLNIKIIDKKSRYVKMVTLQNHNAASALDAFVSYQRRLERRTGNKIKFFQCDDGTEFKGVFSDHLKKEGIVKQKGEPYEHHIPGQGENAHSKILERGRTMLYASKLPIEYYAEAQLTAAYLHNRYVHADDIITPYEHIHKKRPNLAHLRPFGCIGYAFIPLEKRNHPLLLGKLELPGVRCRLLGYADDDDLEEMKAYKVLVESDMNGSPYIMFTKNVTFDENAKLTPLDPNSVYDGSPLLTLVHKVLKESLTQDPDDFLPGDDDDNNDNNDDYTNQDPIPQDSDDDNDDNCNSDDFKSLPTNSSIEENSDTSSEDDLDSSGDFIGSIEENSDTSSEDDLDSSGDFIGFCDDYFDNQGDERVDDYCLSASDMNSFKRAIQEQYGNILSKEQFTTAGLNAETLMYAFLAISDGIACPMTAKEALSGPEADEWRKSMDQEMAKIKSYDTFTLVPIPSKSTNIVKCRWVFRKKPDSAGNVKEYKSRLVAKGFTQKYGVDFIETFAPVAKLKSIRALIGISASLGLVPIQNDVPSAFLWPELKELIFMEQPIGYNDDSGMVWKLNRTIYGLKQSPREFNSLVDAYLVREGFTPTPADPCIYTRDINGSNPILIGLYVDDIITAGRGNIFNEFNAKLEEKFKMKPGEPLDWYLGTRFIVHDNGDITMDQESYVSQKLDEFSPIIGPGKRSSPLPSNYIDLIEKSNDEEVISDFPYREMVGSLMYAMVTTRFDIAFAVSLVCKFLSKPTKSRCDLVKHIYLYLRSDPGKKLRYKKGCTTELEGYVDASFGMNANGTSTTGFVFTLGGTPVSWFSKAQSTVALSAAESEYLAATEAAKECVWLKQLLFDLGFPQGCITLYEDNEACIALSKNPQYHSKTKHIQLPYHFIREKVAAKEMLMTYVNTKHQLADIFTKGLSGHIMRSALESLNLQ